MALGDGKLIAERFEKRAVTLSIWSQVEQALDRAQRAGGSPEQILKAADDLIESVSDPVLRNHGTFASARRLKTQPAARAPATSADILARLRRDVQLRRQALQAHFVQQK